MDTDPTDRLRRVISQLSGYQALILWAVVIMGMEPDEIEASYGGIISARAVRRTLASIQQIARLVETGTDNGQLVIMEILIPRSDAIDG